MPLYPFIQYVHICFRLKEQNSNKGKHFLEVFIHKNYVID